MSFVAAAIGIGGVAAGAASYFGATQAANTQASAEAQALGLQQQEQQYLKNQAAPFIGAGTNAINTLNTLGQNGDYSAFYNSPDYQFAKQQGNAALQNYLNANGISLSGAGITDAINYNQGLATQQFGNYYNRLMQIATLGNNAIGNIAGPSAGVANASANTLGSIGASQASGIVGGANAISGAIGGSINNALLYNAINRNNVNPSSYAPQGQAVNYLNGPFQAQQ